MLSACLGISSTAWTMSAEEMEELVKMGFSREEASKLIEEINALPQEELDKYARYGQQIMDQAAAANIDINDEEQFLNFAAQLPPPDDFFAPTAPAVDKPKVEQRQPEITSPAVSSTPGVTPPTVAFIGTDPEILAQDIITHLASLRQKANAKDSLRHKLEGPLSQELDQLVYYIHIITQERLLPLLKSKEFSSHYKTLENLRAALAMHEPSITPKVTFDDGISDPYDTLGLSYKASQQEIDAKFNELRQKFDPSIRTEKAALNQHDQKQQLKDMQRMFNVIKMDYESLKDPVQKRSIDRALSEHIAMKKQVKAKSDSAFKQVISAIQHAVYNQEIIQHMQELLTKYAPEEKKLAEEWEKQKKSAWEQAKKEASEAVSRAKQAQSAGLSSQRSAANSAQEAGERFWSQYRPTAINTPAYRPSSYGAESGAGRGGPSAMAPDAKKDSAGGKKAGAGKDAGKKDDIDKDSKAATSPADPKKITALQKEHPYESLLMSTKEFEALKKDLAQPESKEGSIKNVFNKLLPAYLAQPVSATTAIRSVTPLTAQQTSEQSPEQNADALSTAHKIALAKSEDVSEEYAAVVNQLYAQADAVDQAQATLQANPADAAAQQKLTDEQKKFDTLNNNTSEVLVRLRAVAKEERDLKKELREALKKAPRQLATKQAPKQTTDKITEETVLKAVSKIQLDYLGTIAGNLAKLSALMADASPAKAEALANMWQDVVKKYKPSVEQLKQLANDALNPIEASNKGRRIDPSKVQLHALKFPDNPEERAQVRKKALEAGSKAVSGQAGFLGTVKHTIDTITLAFEGITQKVAKAMQAAKSSKPAQNDQKATQDSTEKQAAEAPEMASSAQQQNEDDQPAQ